MGEKRVCTTSLESMIDFVSSEFRSVVKVLSTTVIKGDYPVQNYTLVGEVRKLKLNGKKLPNMVVCHKLSYRYVV